MSHPSSPNSLGSGAMSESEDEAPISATTNDISDTRYPVDGKFVSTREKSEIMAMPEAKREQILAERQEEIDKENFSRQLLQRREAAQRDEAAAAEKKKRKSTAADLDDDSPRKASRQKTEATDRLANYKRRREQMNEARRSGTDRRDRGMDDPSRLFDNASDADSDVGYGNRTTNPSTTAQREPTLRDFERCRLGRTNFSIVCFTPGFEQAMEGCFVRVNLGVNQQTGQNVYRMTQIREIITAKRYGMEDRDGKPFSTDQWVRTGSGTSEKNFPFIACSDSPFTEQEYSKFKNDQVRDGMKVPTLAILENRLNGIHTLLNHRWTSAEITEKLKRSGRAQAQSNRLELARLNAELRQAEAAGDSEQIEKLRVEMEELDGPKLVFGNNLFNGNRSTAKQSPAISASEQQRMQRYEAARKAERERQRKAELAERRRAKAGLADYSARVKTNAITHLDAAKYDSARSKTGTPEPSSQINGASALKPGSGNTLQVPGTGKELDDLFGEGGSSRANSPAKSVDGSKAASKQGTPVPTVTVKGLGNGIIGSKRKTDDDHIAAIGLDLDIDI